MKLEERLAAHARDDGGRCTADEHRGMPVRYPCDAAQARDLWGPVVEAAEEAFDLLGGMWSWSEENGYLERGNTWPLQAGRVLRKALGRPANPPALDAAGEGPR